MFWGQHFRENFWCLFNIVLLVDYLMPSDDSRKALYVLLLNFFGIQTRTRISHETFQ